MESRDEEVQPQLLSDVQFNVATCDGSGVTVMLSSMKEHLYIWQKIALRNRLLKHFRGRHGI
jgi:hypothetical protein